ncbi:MAG: site-specific DNA-methyltransferase [Ruthenibacterium sp.]|jgi:adenine-specific DNA-methyltransferase
MTDKLDGLSMDIEATNKEKLQAVFPECFTEGKLDIDKLLSLCGEYITDDFEKYEFKWKGKSECLRLAQRRSTATLRPCPSESVHFDTTQNLYIEGDNLEVLKLLQKSYFRKVKMIYIDPPYNTGNDFVYEDDFSDPMRRYVEVTQQTTKSNPETMGRYHTNWLNMMYPRLRLAANLLRDDGVIFISIDDNEVANLRKLCDEVFGEENFVDTIIWKKKYGGGAKEKYLVSVHEYVLFYAKHKALLPEILVNFSEDKSDRFYKYKDENFALRGFYRTHPLEAVQSFDIRENLRFGVTAPDGTVVYPKRQWRWSRERFDEALSKNEVIFKRNKDGSYVLYSKQYINDENGERRKTKAQSLIDDVFTQEGSKEMTNILSDTKIFPFPKPTTFMKKIIEISGISNNDVILDFFSGSATTAHAVMQLNAEDGGNRRYICVQLPELCDEKSEAFKAGYKNICEIGKERIRRAGAKILEEVKQKNNQLKLGEEPKPLPDAGFKVFKLDTSNMKIWDDTPIEDGDVATLFDRIDGHIDGLKPDRSDEDLIYEILLKMGYPLTAGLATADVGGLTVYKVEGGTMLVCLQEGITAEHVEQMAALSPQKVVLAGRGLADSSTKANAFYLLENKGIELKTI